jgi:hypothetical protein
MGVFTWVLGSFDTNSSVQVFVPNLESSVLMKSLISLS